MKDEIKLIINDTGNNSYLVQGIEKGKKLPCTVILKCFSREFIEQMNKIKI